jgi:hypothetical protein
MSHRNMVAAFRKSGIGLELRPEGKAVAYLGIWTNINETATLTEYKKPRGITRHKT